MHGADAGGAERMAIAEAGVLAETHDVVVSAPPGPLRAELAPYGEIVGGAANLPLWGGSPRRWVASAVRTLLDAVRLARAIRRLDVDVVLTNSSVLVAPVLAARLTRRPVVVHVRESVESRLTGPVFELHRRLATTVIVIDREHERRFTRASGGARVATIHDGIELAPPRAPELRRLHDPLRLCLIGGVAPRKGQDLAVETLGSLARAGVAAELSVVGREIDAPFAGKLRERARALGVADRLRFTGELPSVAGELARADVLVVPSRAERTPLAIMEAMAEGIPVVATDVGGVAELVLDRETGWLIPPGDPAALTGALTDIAAEPDRALEIAARARAHVAAEFSLAGTLAGVRDEVDRLIAGRARSGAGRPLIAR